MERMKAILSNGYSFMLDPQTADEEKATDEMIEYAKKENLKVVTIQVIKK